MYRISVYPSLYSRTHTYSGVRNSLSIALCLNVCMYVFPRQKKHYLDSVWETLWSVLSTCIHTKRLPPAGGGVSRKCNSPYASKEKIGRRSTFGTCGCVPAWHHRVPLSTGFCEFDAGKCNIRHVRRTERFGSVETRPESWRAVRRHTALTPLSQV